ncbi:MAG: hypothetical protein Q4B65_01425 [Candidatus Saccharibacteria bacterium]|nr:hypothetical protein [Candidatus Saccharibacteria bacterium]
MDYEKERNFNANQAPWDVTPNRDPRALGNRIISTPETTIENPSGSEQLGQILPAEPSMEIPVGAMPPEEKAEFDPNLIKEEKGKKRIGKEALASTIKVIEDFKKDGNTSKLYEAVRGEGGITETYIYGSFDRKLGESK